MPHVLALDLGGTKLAIGVISSEGGVLLDEKKPVEAQKGSEYLLELVLQAISSKLNQARTEDIAISAVGVGSPGPLDYGKGIILEPPNLPWRKVPLKQIISDLVDLPVFVDNDANCALLGEAWLGTARGYRSAIMLTLGTGIGGALMQSGEIYHGEFGSAELGHRIFFREEQACNMGHRGCLESLSSGIAIEREAKESTKRVFEKMRAGDQNAAAIVRRAAKFVARGLEKLNEEYHPQVVILGGGMSGEKEYADLILENIKDTELKRKVKVAQLGEKSGLLGAGRLAFLGLKRKKSNKVIE